MSRGVAVVFMHFLVGKLFLFECRGRFSNFNIQRVEVKRYQIYGSKRFTQYDRKFTCGCSTDEAFCFNLYAEYIHEDAKSNFNNSCPSTRACSIEFSNCLCL